MKTLLFTFAAALTCPLALGQPSKVPRNPTGARTGAILDAGAPWAQAVTIADVNLDGKMDLLVANASGVSVLLGNGDGSFQPAVVYDSGGYLAYSVAVGDVNGDGKPDLVVANFCADGNCPYDGGGGAAVLLGNGDGTFAPVVVYKNGYFNNFSVALADVNGDGKLDIVMGCGACSDAGVGCWQGQVSVLLGNGDGTFGQATNYDSGGLDAQAIVVADVNGDGKPDILAGSCHANFMDVLCITGMVAELLGNGDGTFQPPAFYNAGGLDPTSIAVADVDGDGNLDLVVANGKGAAELLGDGKGGFQTKTVALPIPPLALAVGGINNGGKVDVVVDYRCGTRNCIPGIGAVGLALGRGNGVFRLENGSLSSGGFDAVSVAVGDLDGDGRPDIAVANLCGNSDNCGSDDGTVGLILSNHP